MHVDVYEIDSSSSERLLVLECSTTNHVMIILMLCIRMTIYDVLFIP
jgi:hypothetical protein